MLNRIIIMGRLARDPELRHTLSGAAAAKFTLAEHICFAGSRKEAGCNAPEPDTSPEPGPASEDQFADMADDDGELPF